MTQTEQIMNMDEEKCAVDDFCSTNIESLQKTLKEVHTSLMLW